MNCSEGVPVNPETLLLAWGPPLHVDLDTQWVDTCVQACLLSLATRMGACTHLCICVPPSLCFSWMCVWRGERGSVSSLHKHLVFSTGACPNARSVCQQCRPLLAAPAKKEKRENWEEYTRVYLPNSTVWSRLLLHVVLQT
jgi:hypothetical protein